MNIRNVLSNLKRVAIFIFDYSIDKRYKEYCTYKIAKKYNRIYLYHIRKTGGTSLNKMFLSLNGDNEKLYKNIVDSISHRTLSNGYIYQGWNPLLIRRGNYYYAFSHIPYHKVELPDGTFKITCLRDPVKRVISHYNMIKEDQSKGLMIPSLTTERKWLGNCFSDFLDRIPKEHLLNQLYMFSKNYNIDEAVENITSLEHFFFTEDFNHGVDELNKKLSLSLKPIHVRKASSNNISILDHELERLNEMLTDEISLINKLRKMT